MKTTNRQRALYRAASSLRSRTAIYTQLHCKPQTNVVAVKEVEPVQSQEDFPLEQTGWLEKNPAALALVKLGMAQAKEGKVKRISFAEYADLEIDD